MAREIKATIKKKNERYKGSINIDSDQIPEAKNWKLDDEVEVTVKIKVKALRKPDRWEKEDYEMTDKTIKVDSEVMSISTDKPKAKSKKGGYVQKIN